MAKEIDGSAFRMAEIIAALMWSPKSNMELEELLNVSRASIWRYTSALHKSGVIRKRVSIEKRARGYAARQWELQSKPFELADEK